MLFRIRWAGTLRHFLKRVPTLTTGSCTRCFIRRCYVAQPFASLWLAMKCWQKANVI
ncbi:Uncharacterised protein [Vibrio cholerae]|nr:Uncharacterised protein [Vibrio cholerae]